MSKIDFVPTLPAAMQPSVPFSSSDFIAARREKIFLPDSQTTYSFEGNDRLTFTLNSTNEMIDGQNSWIEFDLTVVGTGDNLTPTQRTQKIIDAGGAHALFRRLQISLSNGTQIEDLTGYNKLYSIIRHNTVSENHVRYVEGPLSGDSVASDAFEVSQYDTPGWRDITTDLAATTFVINTQTFAAMGATANVFSELAVGDVIRVAGKSGGNEVSFTGVISALVTNQSFTLSGGGGSAFTAADANNRITSLQVARRSGPLSARYRAGSTDGIKLKMKPFSNFLQNSKFVPLMFLKNLQLTFELERGALAFKFLAAPGNNASITYTISNPRYVCSLITPAEPYLQSMLDAYNTMEGIYYPYISFQHNLKFLAAGASGSVTIPSNCRSAKAWIAAQYLALSEAVAAGSYVNDTVSLTVKNLMTTFQLKIGSENYPYARGVDCDDIFNGETLAHLQKALDSFGNILHDNSMIPSDYWAVNTVNGVLNESRRFVMGLPLARDMSSSATGVDAILNDLQLEYTRSGPGVDCYLRSWIIYDGALQISRMSTIVFK